METIYIQDNFQSFEATRGNLNNNDDDDDEDDVL